MWYRVIFTHSSVTTRCYSDLIAICRYCLDRSVNHINLCPYQWCIYVLVGFFNPQDLEYCYHFVRNLSPTVHDFHGSTCKEKVQYLGKTDHFRIRLLNIVYVFLLVTFVPESWFFYVLETTYKKYLSNFLIVILMRWESYFLPSDTCVHIWTSPEALYNL